MRGHQIGHAVKSEIDMRHVAWIAGCTESLLVMPPIDPAIVQPVPIGRRMVMEHAFRRVQNIALRNIPGSKLFDHIFEIAIRRFVEAYILSRVNGIKRDPEPGVALRKAGPINI